MSLIVAILVFGLIVLIHEFGHFIMAKRCGIGVLEFAIGMGPSVVSFVKGETKYSINIIPFGGYCMMQDEDAEAVDDKSFNSKSVWARIAVIAAGPVFNFLLALVLGIVLVSAVGYDSPQLIDVQEGFPAQEQGMQAGDIITRLDGEPVVIYRDVRLHMMLNPVKTVEVEYKRPSTDGKTMETRTALITPKYSEEYGTYMLGIVVNGAYQPVEGIGETLKYGAYEAVFNIKNTIKSIGMMIRGQVGMDDMAGPIQMVSIIDDTVDHNLQYGIRVMLLSVANLCVLLSANLGVMNLLPIPALDGGRLLFLLIEAVRGKPLDKKKEGFVHMIGMAFLMTLMIMILFNDVSKLFFR